MELPCRLLLFFMFLMMFFCGCEKSQQAVDTPAESKAGAVSAVDSNVIAEIEGFVITRQMLEKRLMSEISPGSYFPVRRPQPPRTEEVVLMMVAERAMAIEGRKLNYMQDPGISRQIRRLTEERISNLLLSKYIGSKKITVTPAEVAQKLKTDSRLDPQRAAAMINREKSFALIDGLYNQLAEKFHVEKSRTNITRSAKIYGRLLAGAESPYSVRFVTLKQIRGELTEQEKGLVLATYDGGKVTLEDWFYALHEVGPPSRPKDLDTEAGFERFLDRAVLRKPLFVAEAKAAGLDKDENLLKEIKRREDILIINKAIMENAADFNEPSPQQIASYFNQHREDFMSPLDTVEIDQIWCENLETARQVKANLDAGGDFESLRQKYSLDKRSGPVKTTVAREGLFFERLWNGKPGEIIGPIKGFYNRGLSWRIVKIINKTAGKFVEYSSKLDGEIRNRMQKELIEANLTTYRKKLLKKYSYEIYPERFADLLDFP